MDTKQKRRSVGAAMPLIWLLRLASIGRAAQGQQVAMAWHHLLKAVDPTSGLYAEHPGIMDRARRCFLMSRRFKASQNYGSGFAALCSRQMFL